MASQATGVDLGSHAAKAVTSRVVKGAVLVTRFTWQPAESGADAATTGGAPIPMKSAVVGLTGRDMILRYTQVPQAPDWQLKNLMDLEVQELSSQSGGDLASDFNLLPGGDDGAATVLLALAKESALAERRGRIEEQGGTVEAFTPNCVALYNAYLRCGEVTENDVMMVASLGQETIDLVVVRGADLLFARNVTTGAKVLDTAISAAFNVSGRKAASLRTEFLDLDPQSRGRYASHHAEKVSQAALGAAGQLAAAFQSTLSFCKAQIRTEELKLAKVLVCGGLSKLKGLRAYLRESLHCPVEPFEPFGNADVSQLPPDEAEMLERHKPEAVVALGLSLAPLDKALYSLEILPENVRRRRTFVERTLYTIVAGLLAAGFLAWWTTVRRDDHDRAAAAARTVSVQRKRIEDNNREAERLEKLAADEHRMAVLLSDRAVPLHGTLHVLRTLQELMPEDLWIASLEVKSEPAPWATAAAPGAAGGTHGGASPGAAAASGAGRVTRRLVKVTLKGKEVTTTNLTQTYNAFVEKLTPRMPKMVHSLTSTPGGPFQASLTLDYQQAL